MIENFWKDKYPVGIAAEVNPDQYPSILSILRESCQRLATKPAFANLDKTLTYGELYKLSGGFAAYLQQHTDLKPDDCIAVQLPNVLRYPIVVFDAMRADLIVANADPLYTAHELEHQLNDSGTKAMVCLANIARLAEGVLPKTGIKQVIVTKVGDILPSLKCFTVNFVVKHIKKMVLAYNLSQTTKLTDTLARGTGRPFQEAAPQTDDVAVLQYTGGTTGVAKGAMLTHRNLMANMLQYKAPVDANLNEGRKIPVAPLPLYHVYAFIFHCMAMMLTDNRSILITNSRDLPSMFKNLGQWKFIDFVGLNTLFVAPCNNKTFRKLDFSTLKLTPSGGMAPQLVTVERWKEVTGCTTCEGCDMAETASVIPINPFQNIQVGTIGVPVSSTLCKVIGGDGQKVPLGEHGELCTKGPQVTEGYWQRQETTDGILGANGQLKTGDIAIIQEGGYMRIVDRKRGMVLVFGFNVYPNELGDMLATLPGVLQCATIGILDEKSGELIKIFVVVKSGATLTKEQVMQHMHDSLTGYKRPKVVEFRDSPPATNVGKILCRELHDEELKKAGQK